MIRRMSPRQAYLDYQATTPLDPRVLQAMRPYFEDHFGNPHSINHVYGWKTADAVRAARGHVADFIGADEDEIVFTSGATESCNLALRGIAKASKGNMKNQVRHCNDGTSCRPRNGSLSRMHGP